MVHLLGFTLLGIFSFLAFAQKRAKLFPHHLFQGLRGISAWRSVLKPWANKKSQMQHFVSAKHCSQSSLWWGSSSLDRLDHSSYQQGVYPFIGHWSRSDGNACQSLSSPKSRNISSTLNGLLWNCVKTFMIHSVNLCYPLKCPVAPSRR